MKRTLNAFKNKNLAIFFLAILPSLIVIFLTFNSQVTFYYDQARDFFEAYSIWHDGNIKILGPATDIEGVFHGVLWYYLLAIPSALFNGNPYLISVFMAGLLILSLYGVWLLARDVFKSYKYAAITVLLYSLSPIFQLSTRWISNPILSLIVSPFLLLSFKKFIAKPSIKKATLVGVLFGLLIHGNTGFLLFLLIIPIYLLLSPNKKISWENCILFIALLITLSSYLVAEIKYDGRGIENAIKFASMQNKEKLVLSQYPQKVLGKANQLFYFTTSPLSAIIFIGIILLGLKNRKGKESRNLKTILFFGVWIVFVAVYQLFNSGLTRSIFVHFPYIVPTIILFVLSLKIIVNNKSILLYFSVVIVTFIQITTTFNYYKNNQNPLTVQKGINLLDETKVLNYTYTKVNNNEFTINTITSPLYINSTWSYLYYFVGKASYGYVPFWEGRNQEGIIGGDKLTKPTKKTQYKYLIIEPTTGISDFFLKQEIEGENNLTRVTNKSKIGEFVVEDRNYLDL